MIEIKKLFIQSDGTLVAKDVNDKWYACGCTTTDNVTSYDGDVHFCQMNKAPDEALGKL